MTKWFQWLVLANITGSPIGALVILLAFWWTLDHFTLRLLPNPFRGALRWRRGRQLEVLLRANPSDRRARHELADIWVEQRRFSAAVEVLRPSIEAGEQAPAVLFLLGTACAGAGDLERAERVFLAILEDEPEYRQDSVLLALGRVRLKRGDLGGAEAALAEYCTKRRSTVEGRVLLAEVRTRQGDLAAARRLKDEAWDEYASSPSYQRRQDRLWAWRARPLRPAMYCAVVIGLVGLIGLVAPT